MQSDRIWVTGVGVVSSLGAGAPASFARLVAGERGLAPLRLFDAAGQRAAMVGSVNLAGYLPPAGPKPWSRTSLLALRAADEAMAEAGLGKGHGRRVGLVVGGTTGGMFETETLLADLHTDPDRTESLREMISQPLTATGDRLASVLGPFCRVRTLCSACSSGANAFVVGALWLLQGDVDAVVVGGSDGLCRLTLSGFNALAATDPDPCRPFDVNRKGLNLGEGAGFAVLERSSGARRPIAELAGWAIGAEAHHITHPEPSGAAAARVIERSLSRARLAPREVDYVNAHGTATPHNDVMEAGALQRALGAEVERIPVSSSKGQIGHTLGAAGAIEAIFAALAVKGQVVPPTAGLATPDPACRLVHVLGEGRRARVRAALSNSFGFGGMDTVLVLTEPELSPAPSVHARQVVVTGVATLTARGMDDDATARDLVVAVDAPRGPIPSGPIAADVGALLATDRARRLDRPARLGAAVAERALLRAAGQVPLAVTETGVVLGTAFGSLDASAAFMHRIFERGPRFASPAEFPNLVPSAPVGHASIYLGLQGATLATADLATSGESAVAQAIELVAAGEVDAVVAGAVEEASTLVERIQACLEGADVRGARRPRSEGASALVVEEASHASRRGARPLAVVRAVHEWTDLRPHLVAPRDASRARVVSARDDAEVRALVQDSGWGSVPRARAAPVAGDHEGLGGVVLAAATALLGQADVDEVLVVGVASGRGYAFLLGSP